MASPSLLITNDGIALVPSAQARNGNRGGSEGNRDNNNGNSRSDDNRGRDSSNSREETRQNSRSETQERDQDQSRSTPAAAPSANANSNGSAASNPAPASSKTGDGDGDRDGKTGTSSQQGKREGATSAQSPQVQPLPEPATLVEALNRLFGSAKTNEAPGDAKKHEPKPGEGHAQRPEHGARTHSGQREHGRDEGTRSRSEQQARSGGEREREREPLARGKKSEGEPSNTVAQTTPATTKTTPKTASPAPSATAIQLPPIGSKPYVSGEVLARNLSAEAREAAIRLRFVPKPAVVLGSLGASITELIVPPDMDTVTAQKLLERELPKQHIALNAVYRIYRPSSNGGDKQTDAARRPGTAPICPGDRCMRDLIGWKDEAIERCSKGLKVAVIDTGVDQAHPALEWRSTKTGVFIPNGRQPAPNWHGTAVMTLLAGHPQSGTPGLIPQAQIHLANVFYADGAGGFATDSLSVLSALEWAAALDIKLVNMSFAGPKDDLVRDAIARLSASGMVFVAAAGNNGPASEPRYPAAYEQVIAVTAVARDKSNYPYAVRGRHIDIAAPGVDVWTALPDGREGVRTGTSFAAPYVTAALATILPAQKHTAKGDLLDRLDVVDLGDPGPDAVYGRGLVKAPVSCKPEKIARQRPTPASPAGTETGSVAGTVSWQPEVRSPAGQRSAAPSAGFR